jgi:hypothetical protein
MYWLATFEAFLKFRRTVLAGTPAVTILERAKKCATKSRENVNTPPAQLFVNCKYLSDIFKGYEQYQDDFCTFAQRHESKAS